MGLLIEYFAAPSDEEASAFIDGGGPVAAGLPAVSGDGVEPFVLMGVLEELLTSRSYDEIAAAGQPIVAERDEGERLIVRLTDSLTRALAEADAERVVAVAEPWSQAEEFYGGGEAEPLAEFLSALAELARQAIASGSHLYCWVVV